VRAHEPDKHDLELILHRDNDPIFVAPDVEHHSIVGDKTRVTISLFDVYGRLPMGMFDIGIPSLKRLPSVGMVFPKEAEGFSGDDPHVDILLCSREGINGASIKPSRAEPVLPLNADGELLEKSARSF